MTMTALQLFGRDPAGSNIAASFGMASAVVIAGVLAAWVLVKRDATVSPDAMLDRESQVAIGAKIERERPASNSLLEQAEIAFAAGRIIEPEFDNALNYYRSLLETEPDNKDAAQGVDRVIAYLENQAEGAVFQSDWDFMAWPRDALMGPVARLPWVRGRALAVLSGQATGPFRSIDM